MTLNEFIKIINGKTSLNSDDLIGDIKTDTRNLNKGDIFIALKGKKLDGINYIDDALNKGASCVVSCEQISDKCIVVDDTYETLFLIGKYIRNKYNIPLIAITGSNGKTTTKELLSHILKSKYNVLKNEGNKNNIIGVFETLNKLDKNTELIVLEIGSNHFGEIEKLSYMISPNTSIITNIGSSHLEYFKKRKNIFKEKLSIKRGMKNDDIIVNGDDKYLKKLKYFKCGIKRKNNLKAYNIYSYKDKVTFNIYLDKEYKIVFNNPGVHFINDILFSIKVSLDYGIKINKIIKKISTFKFIDKRMNISSVGSNILIDDCYNSSFESIKAGLNYMKQIEDKKILIIGDMLELGKYSKKIHKKVNRIVKKIKNKEVYTVGKYSKYIKGIHFNNSNELIVYLKNINLSNSYIYIKGSRKINLDIVVDYIKEVN